MSKRWLLIAAVSMLMACEGGKDKNPHGTPLGSGGPAASGPTGADPHGGGGPRGKEGSDPHGQADKPEDPMVMVHLMHRFTAALSEKPTNAQPSPDWQPLLADAANPITCVDCHPKNGKMMMDRFDGKARPEETEKWEKNPEFMKKLMAKWVKRANENVGGKLKAPLKCSSCHATPQAN